MVIVPDEGEVWMLDQLLRLDPATDDPFHMHLYKNDVAPSAISTVSTFLEADYAGYAIAELIRADWSPAEPVGNVAVSIYGAGILTWNTTTGTQDIYGYYVTDWSNGVCLWAERFPGVVVVGPSIPVLISPLMRLKSEFPLP